MAIQHGYASFKKKN